MPLCYATPASMLLAPSLQSDTPKRGKESAISATQRATARFCARRSAHRTHHVTRQSSPPFAAVAPAAAFRRGLYALGVSSANAQRLEPLPCWRRLLAAKFCSARYVSPLVASLFQRKA